MLRGLQGTRAAGTRGRVPHQAPAAPMRTAVLLVLACAVLPASSWSPPMTSPMLRGLRRGALGAARAMPSAVRPRRSVVPVAAHPAMRLDAPWPGPLGGRAFSRTAALRMAAATDTDTAGLEAQIKAQGDKVRGLKEAKADKAEIDAAVAELKQLKADFEAQAGPIELPTNENNENLLRIRHSSAHVMAMAVQRLYPKAQVTIGPWIDNGFYYDFDLQGDVFEQEDLKKIKKEVW